VAGTAPRTLASPKAAMVVMISRIFRVLMSRTPLPIHCGRHVQGDARRTGIETTFSAAVDNRVCGGAVISGR
jgi:hypothetical protein